MDRHALIASVEAAHIKKNSADVRVGETVRVHYKIREGNKERVQVFEGLVIATKSGQSLQGSFTVRKVVAGIGVERTFPLHSPWIVKIERLKTGKVRRAKLNFVRQYALSSRFKLKDKGKPGTVWEEVVEQQAKTEEAAAEQAMTEPAPETEEVANADETVENKPDELSGESAGSQSGESSSDAAGNEEVSDSSAEPKN